MKGDFSPNILALVDKYAYSIYTRVGDPLEPMRPNWNLKTVRKIALEAGLIQPSVHRSDGMVFINCVCIDPYNEAREEVRNVYEFCRHLIEAGHNE